MKKLSVVSGLVLIMTAVLVLGACGDAAGGGGAAAPAEQPPAQQQPVADTAPADDDDLEDLGLLRNAAWTDTLTVQFATPQVRDGVDYNACALTRYFTDRFNIEWEMIPLTWDNWAEMLRIWINAGDMPDKATWNYVHGEAVLFARDDLVRRMPDDWQQRWPNAAAAVQASVIGPAVAEIVGGYYFLHKPIFAANRPTDPLVGHQVMYMRRDWMEAVGAEIKPTYTMSEILDIARAIQAQDPGDVGSALVPISFNRALATSNFINRQFAFFDRFYLGDDGYYHWGPANPAVLEGLRLYQTAFREGLLHPDFFLWTSDEDIQHFRSLGVAGMYSQEGMAVFIQGVAQDLEDQGLNPEEAMHVAVILGEDGYYHEMEMVNFWTSLIFSPNMPDADFERLMYLIDYTAEPETQLTIRMGFEGEHWERDGQGGFRMLLPPGTDMWDIFPSTQPLWGNHLVLSDDFALISPVFLPEFREMTNEMYATKARMSNPQTVRRVDWTEFFHDSTSRRMVSLPFSDMFTELIMMDGDIEANWLSWVDAQRPLVDPVIAELNALR